MKPLTVFGRSRFAPFSKLFLGALLLAGACASPLVMAQCPPGQHLYQAQVPTGAVRVVPVPGSAGGIPSGVMLQPGDRWVMTASGSIRVGVFGETGTPPEGWVPQGDAGPGFPESDAPTYSLLFRIGPAGAWHWLGTEAVATLGKYDPPGSQIYFGINDNKLSDNSGLFNVVLTQTVLGTKCAVPPLPASVGIGFSSSSSSTSHAPMHTTAGPCAGTTSDGRMLSFQFPVTCPTPLPKTIPVEACTRAAAITQAQALARADGCALTTN
jgi:hypothetical protein